MELRDSGRTMPQCGLKACFILATSSIVGQSCGIHGAARVRPHCFFQNRLLKAGSNFHKNSIFNYDFISYRNITRYENFNPDLLRDSSNVGCPLIGINKVPQTTPAFTWIICLSCVPVILQLNWSPLAPVDIAAADDDGADVVDTVLYHLKHLKLKFVLFLKFFVSKILIENYPLVKN